MKKIRLSPINGLPLEEISLPLDYQNDNQITNKPAIPHDAIGQYANNLPFDPNTAGLHKDWLLFRFTTDYSKYALWFKTKNDTPIRVLTNWDLFNDNNINCVKFVANENSSIEVIKSGTVNIDLQYSFDGFQWQTYTTTLNVKVGQTVLFKGNNPYGFNRSDTDFIRFNLIGNISVSGNIMGLLDNGYGNTTEIPNDYCFAHLFEDANGLTTVSKNFLPAVTLKEACYKSMFMRCNSLINAPNLPATELAVGCYWGMFYNCSKLKEAPELPALTLQRDCYRWMFFGNTTLKIAPTLPATTLASNCYQSMFNGCNSLFLIKIEYIGQFTDDFSFWVNGVPSYGIIYYNGSDTTGGKSAIPTGWVKVTF